MPAGTATTHGSIGESISHFTGVRMRIVGAGTLEMSLHSLDDIKSFTMMPFTLAATTNIQPFRLANFNEQRAYFKGQTNGINKWFRINRIIVFSKQLYTDYPG
jgi:hypothetical protein